MNALDGDSDTFAGGVLVFRFNVLVGDANNDGSVNGGDLPSFAASFNKSTGNAAYNSRADWNSDGSVNGGDLPLFANNFNKSLPASEPRALIFPPLTALMELDVLYAPAIDEEDTDKFFAQIETEEDLLNFEARYSYDSLKLLD